MTYILLIVLFFWILHLSGRISDLEKRLEVKLKYEKPASLASDEITVKNQNPHLVPAIAETKNVGLTHTALEQKSEIKPESTKKTESQETEDAVGWLNKIGVVALVLGMGFFFKYAIDQGWINEWARIIIGFIFSGLLVYLGELWKGKFGSKAHALCGGGIALLYFTIYAGYNFYHIFPQIIAFALMLGVAGMSVWLSYRNSSLVLGILGFFGAYGAPPMLGTGTDQQVQLFIFLSIMNLAALAVMLKKYWMELLALALVGSTIDFCLWAFAFSKIPNTLTSVFFVIVTTLIFVVGAAALTKHHNQKKTLPTNVDNNLGVFSFLVGMFYFTSIFLLLNQSFHNLLAPIALLGSVIFFFSYALVDRLEYKTANYLVSMVGTALLVSAAIWHFDGKALGLVLLGISLIGSAVGALVKREELRTWSMLILFVALFKSLIEPYSPSDTTFLFNAKFGLMFANTLGLLFIGWLYEKVKVSENEKNLENGLQIAAAIVLWVALSWDISSSFTRSGGLITSQYMTLWWVIHPAALAFAAASAKRKGLFQVAIIMLALAFIKVLALSYSPGPLLFYNGKFGLMLLTTLVMLFCARLYAKFDEKDSAIDVLKVAASLLFWFAVSWEVVKHYELSTSHNARNLYLSLWWIVYAVFLMFISNRQKSGVFRKVAILLFGFSIVKVFLYDVQALDTAYRIISFVALGAILLGVSFTYKKNKEKITHFLEGENSPEITKPTINS